MSKNAETVLFDPSVGKSNLRDHIPKESLLAVIQEHPDFSGWKRSGQYFRDPNDSARTLGLNGVKSFKGGISQKLFEVAKERDLLGAARSLAGLPEFSQKGNSTRKRKSTGHNPPADNPNVDTQPDDPLSNSASPTAHSRSKQTKPKSSTTPQAQLLWKQPESDKAKTAVQKYLTDSALVTENYEDLFGSYMRCVIDNTASGKGSPALVVPMLTPEQASRVAIGAPTSADKVARVLLPESAKPEKKQLGSPDDGIGRISYLPTRTENCESLKYLVCEGFRDALSIRTHYPDHHIFVCQSKGNLQHVPGFLPEGANVLIISDHDGHDDPNQNGETDAAKLRQELLRRGYSCQALMPPEPKKDANDALRDGKLDQWLKELVEVPELARPVDDFYFEPRSSLGIQEPDWLIKGIIEKGTLAAIVGESGSGKSFLALDLACCIATGTNWHGRAVNCGDVCYLAGEGKGGLARRIGAWENYYSSKQVPLFISSRSIDLGDSRDQLPKVRHALRSLDRPPALIIIDTLARHHTGDENSATEMSSFIGNLDQLREEFNAAVVVVHHSGKDPSRGARGSSAFRAALDHEILVTKPATGVITVACEKAKDSEPFSPMSFNLSSTDVLDESGRLIAENDGSPVRSCVLEPTEFVQRSKQWRPSVYQQLFIESFNELRQDSQNPDRVQTNKLRERIKNKLPQKSNDQFKAIWRDLKGSKLSDQYDIGEVVVIERTDLTGFGG